MSPELEPSLAPDELSALGGPGAYPDDPSAGQGVAHVQTHLSHVFLSPDRVYKFRKAVDLGFVCFATRDDRNADCLREVALNRRLAGDVYLGLAPLVGGSGGARLGPLSEALAGDAEHCVVMRRLPDGRDAHSLLSRGALLPAQIDRVAVVVAAFHEAHGLGRPAPWDPESWRTRLRSPVLANFAQLHGPAIDAPTEALVRELVSREAAVFEASRDAFERRRVAGRAVDGHGDLHLEHVWFEEDDAEPVMIDCVEFDADLRRIDAASEMAFPLMDLRYRDHAELGERLLRVYARERDDFDLYAVLDYFVSYRATVRAKVASIAARQAEVPAAQREAAGESARRHLGLALDALAEPAAGALWMVGGIVGTGKSTVADELADALGGVVVSSDRVRKRLAGLAPTARTEGAEQAALYSTEKDLRTYAGLLERAAPVVASGRPAILDATFARRADRVRAAAWARDRGLAARFALVACAEEVALERLARRRERGGDPSDAGPELYAAKVRAFEPLGDEAPASRLTVHTDAPDWRARLRQAAQGRP